MAQRKSGSATAKKKTADRSRARKDFQDRAPTRGTAPSAPDIRKLQLLEPSQHAKDAEPSDVDAMGKDKRRGVIGHSYGPSRAKSLLFYGLALGGIVVLLVGGKMLVDKYDKGPATDQAKAPWAQPAAPQTPAVRPQ